MKSDDQEVMVEADTQLSAAEHGKMDNAILDNCCIIQHGWKMQSSISGLPASVNFEYFISQSCIVSTQCTTCRERTSTKATHSVPAKWKTISMNK